MAVIDKHRIIKDSWTFGICENCHQNPEKLQMTKEFLVSGDPGRKHKSRKEVWVCPRCGYSRKL